MSSKPSIVLPGRSTAAPDLKPAAKPPKKPPTIHELSEALYRYAREMDFSDDFVAEIFAFAAGSVHTAWSLVDFAFVAVRAYQANRKLKGDRRDYVGEFEKHLQEQHKADLNATAEEKKEGNLLLSGLPQGMWVKRGPAVTAVIIAWTRPSFDAPKGTPFEQEDIPKLVYRNQRFALWMLENALTGNNLEAFKAEFEAASEEDRRAEAAAEAGEETVAAPGVEAAAS